MKLYMRISCLLLIGAHLLVTTNSLSEGEDPRSHQVRNASHCIDDNSTHLSRNESIKLKCMFKCTVLKHHNPKKHHDNAFFEIVSKYVEGTYCYLYNTFRHNKLCYKVEDRCMDIYDDDVCELIAKTKRCVANVVRNNSVNVNVHV